MQHIQAVTEYEPGPLLLFFWVAVSAAAPTGSGRWLPCLPTCAGPPESAAGRLPDGRPGGGSRSKSSGSFATCARQTLFFFGFPAKPCAPIALYELGALVRLPRRTRHRPLFVGVHPGLPAPPGRRNPNPPRPARDRGRLRRVPTWPIACGVGMPARGDLPAHVAMRRRFRIAGVPFAAGLDQPPSACLAPDEIQGLQRRESLKVRQPGVSQLPAPVEAEDTQVGKGRGGAPGPCPSPAHISSA